MMPDFVSRAGRRCLSRAARCSSSSDRAYRASGRTRGYSRSTVSVLWFSTSGSAAITASSASRFPQKSGISTSMRHSGFNRRDSRMVSAKCADPPSANSSRFTDVMTACASPSRPMASATCRGSSGSRGVPAFARAMAQKVQCRVQVSPRIMNVAVRSDQHS